MYTFNPIIGLGWKWNGSCCRLLLAGTGGGGGDHGVKKVQVIC